MIPGGNNPPMMLSRTGAPPMGRQNQAQTNNQLQELIRLLPLNDAASQDQERVNTREQILEAAAKDIFASDPNVVANIVDAPQSSGNQCVPMNIIDIIVHLESLIYAKYPDTSSMNYKGLSKKLVQGLKTKGDQRQIIVNIMRNSKEGQTKEQVKNQVEDFLSVQYLFGKPKAATTNAQQDNSGNAAVGQGNPFAIPRPGAPGATNSNAGGGPPPSRRPPGASGPQNRLPQQRFATGNFFNQPTGNLAPNAAATQMQAPAININANPQNENAPTSLGQYESSVNRNFDERSGDQYPQVQQIQNNHQEQERPPSVHQSLPQQQQQNNNQQNEEIPNFNFADSGAAGSIQLPSKNLTQIPSSSGGAAASGGVSDNADMVFFQNLAETAVRQQRIDPQISAATLWLDQMTQNATNQAQQFGFIGHPSIANNNQQQTSSSSLHHQFSQEGCENRPSENNEATAQNSFFNSHQDHVITGVVGSGMPQQQPKHAATDSQTHNISALNQEDQSCGATESHTQIDQRLEHQHFEGTHPWQPNIKNTPIFEEEAKAIFDQAEERPLSTQENNNPPESSLSEQQHHQQEEEEGGRGSNNQFEEPTPHHNSYNREQQNENNEEEAQRKLDLLDQRSIGQYEAGDRDSPRADQHHEQPVSLQQPEEDQSSEIPPVIIPDSIQQIVYDDLKRLSEMPIPPQTPQSLPTSQDQQHKQAMLMMGLPPMYGGHHHQFGETQSHRGGSGLRMQTSENELRGGVGGNIQRMNSQTQLSQQQQQIVMKSPSMRGLMHQSSRPPQSVASVNITNLEDSEGIIRAYKKKKAELEEIKEKYYQLETDYFTEKQKNRLLEEDVSKLRLNMSKAEKLLKEVQMKESRKESDMLMKQLQLKQQEASAYQTELSHQKQENAKLREKIKELMARRSVGNSASMSASGSSGDSNAVLLNEQLTRALKEKDDMARTMENLKHQFTQSLQENNDKFNRLFNDKVAMVSRLEQQLDQLKHSQESSNHRSEERYNEIVSEKHKVEDQLKTKLEELEALKEQNEKLKNTANAAALQQKTANENKMTTQKVPTQKSSEESEQEDGSFVHIQGDSKSSPSGGVIDCIPHIDDQADQNYFVGYYDSGNDVKSVNSVKSLPPQTNQAPQITPQQNTTGQQQKPVASAQPLQQNKQQAPQQYVHQPRPMGGGPMIMSEYQSQQMQPGQGQSVLANNLFAQEESPMPAQQMQGARQSVPQSPTQTTKQQMIQQPTSNTPSTVKNLYQQQPSAYQEAENFFGQLSNQPMKTQTYQKQQQVPNQQPKAQQKPPQVPTNNPYNFTLDDISFQADPTTDNSFTTPQKPASTLQQTLARQQTPAAQQHQQQQQFPYPQQQIRPQQMAQRPQQQQQQNPSYQQFLSQPMQQQPIRNVPPTQTHNPYQQYINNPQQQQQMMPQQKKPTPLQQQIRQPPVNNYANFMMDNAESQQQLQHGNNSGVIPKSLFD